MSKTIIGKLAKLFTRNKSAKEKALEAEKAAFIAQLMALMDENKFWEAGLALNKEVKISRFDGDNDPIIGPLRGRISLGVAAELTPGDFRISLSISDAFTTFFMASCSLHRTRVSMMNSFSKTPSEAEKSALLQLTVVHQYTLFHALKIASDLPHVNLRSFASDWKKQGFPELNNYSGVDPFILKVCPPHHIWKKYIVDDHVYVTQDDGSIKMIPCSEYDFSKEALGTTPSPYKKPKKEKAPTVQANLVS